jgi:hypothetical protein
MGNRRFSRKRLYEVEKAGQPVDLESSIGIKGNIISSTQHRQGQEIITEITIDLGSSNGGAIAGSNANRAIGTAAGTVAITELTRAKYGIITEIRCILAELPKISSTTRAVNVVYADTNVAKDVALTNAVDCTSSQPLNVVGEDRSLAINDDGAKDKFLFVTQDTANAGTYAQGKVVVYIHGFAIPADL